jgi:predicted KAP-like P-loop ATPase
MIIIDNDIKCTKDDLLDFKKLYESISNHLSYYEEKDTLIISIEGEWGSGKTSLSNFIIEKIEEIEEKNIVSNEILHKKIFVIKFSPWMITDLNNLIKYFFSELMKTILKINKKLKKQQVIDDFKKFVQLITPDKFTIGGAEYSIDKFFNSEESIFKSKVKIANYLKDLESKILIVVDDIDRLTDSETEIFFRLIKGIADFDNLIYLLLFDKVIVSNSLKTFKNEDGEKYLDKIIQYSISIPKTSSNILKNQLISKISEIYKPEENNIKFLKFFSIFNKYIKNLRDVKRLSNSLNIEYPLVQDNVNFIDFMIITLIKNQNNKLYNFIKNNKYLFLINHSKEDTENYKKKVLNVLNNEDFNKY